MRFRQSREEQHIDTLAKAAELEMTMGVGNYLDTLAQMHDLINQLDDERKQHRAAEDVLIDQLRRQLSRLETVVHRREQEFDDLQEKYCALIEGTG